MLSIQVGPAALLPLCDGKGHHWHCERVRKARAVCLSRMSPQSFPLSDVLYREPASWASSPSLLLGMVDSGRCLLHTVGDSEAE